MRFEFIKRHTSSDGEEVYILKKRQWKAIVEAALLSVHVDDQFYLDSNHDVREAFSQGFFGSVKDHFVRFGFYEGRPPFAVVVDECYYLTTYEDVAKAIDRGDFENAQDHFDKVGYEEGRLPFDGFRFFAALNEASESKEDLRLVTLNASSQLKNRWARSLSRRL